uniref:Odorant receptor n=1 Tax=Pyrrhalta maculicollis TaxID=226885 RepID=A0A1J0KKI7_9CUCU|nr:odorant receptor 10 [Pyrrhalta maculicollis]
MSEMDNIDYRKFFTFNVRVFKICGVWKPDSNSNNKILITLYNSFCISLWTSFLFSQFMFLYNSPSIFDELLSTSHITIPEYVCSLMFIVIYRKLDLIKLILDKLNEPMFQPKCEEHLQLAKSLEHFYKTYNYSVTYLAIQTSLLFLIIPLWQDEQTLPAKAWFPFEWEPSPNFEMIWVFQSVSVCIVTVNVACLTIYTTGIFMLIGLQCDYLCITFNNLTQFHVENGILLNRGEKHLQISNPKFSDVMLENLVVCIRHYTEIRKMALEIERIHEMGVFILFLGGATMISTILFSLSTVEIGSPQSLMLMSDTMCMLVMQFVYCWFGGEITNKSANVFMTSYNTPWTDCNIRYRKVLLQFMTMTQNPIEMRVGGLLVMSNAVFTSIVKSSYSVYALLHDIEE